MSQAAAQASRRLRCASTSIPEVQAMIQDNPVFIVSKPYCPFCVQAKSCFQNLNANYAALEIHMDSNMHEIQNYMGQLTGATSVPRVFVGGKFIGGGSETMQLYNAGVLEKLVHEAEENFR